MKTEFKLGDLFEAQTGNVDLQQKDINGKGYFLINSGLENHGIKGKTDRKAKVFSAGTITIDFWGNAYYRDFDYVMATHNHVFSLSGECIKNREVGLYLATCLSKFTEVFSYSNMATWTKLKEMTIVLPVIQSEETNHQYTDADIDYQYIYDYVLKIEKSGIQKLDASLKKAGLNDYNLTEEDRKILSKDCEVQKKEFRIGDLFEKRTIKGIPKKKENLEENKNGYHVFGQNIRYQHPQKVLNDNKYLQTVDPEHPILAYTSSVGEVGMISESFYRSGDNGAFQGLFPKFISTKRNLEYILTLLKKHFNNFGYATSMKNILDISIFLPVTHSGEPDWSYMENYIRVIEKIVIKNVVDYKEKITQEISDGHNCAIQYQI